MTSDHDREFRALQQRLRQEVADHRRRSRFWTRDDDVAFDAAYRAWLRETKLGA